MNNLLFLDLGVTEILLVLAYPLLVILCLFDIVRSEFKDSTTKLIWVLIVLFAPFLGSILYLLVGRKSRI